MQLDEYLKDACHAQLNKQVSFFFLHLLYLLSEEKTLLVKASKQELHQKKAW